jgi:hypothetical protein
MACNPVFTGDFPFQGMTVHSHDATTANADDSVTIVEQSSLGDAPLELALTTTAVRQ